MKPYSENCISSIKDELQKQNDNVKDAFSNMQSLLMANQRVTESLDKMMQFKILKESQQMQFQMQMMQNQFTTQSNNEEEKKPKKTQKLIDQKI